MHAPHIPSPPMLPMPPVPPMPTRGGRGHIVAADHDSASVSAGFGTQPRLPGWSNPFIVTGLSSRMPVDIMLLDPEKPWAE